MQIMIKAVIEGIILFVKKTIHLEAKKRKQNKNNVFLRIPQIPDIIRVGARRYFGQTALGGPFHVIL